jgi:hypothetical protein
LTSSVASLFPIQGKAADGCLMLLCLAAPSWQNVAQCADPVREVLRDLARGRPFPTCPMAGNGNIAENQWTNPPYFCPPQYTHSFEAPDNTVYDCDYVGAVTVSVNGSVWSRTWWSTSGREAVTEFTPVAKAQLGSWNTRFDDDYAAWLASLPPIVGCTTC